MIRPLDRDDIARIGEIWLQASLLAHDFVPASFWREDHAVMVNEILPRAEGFLHVTGATTDGFLTWREGTVDCLFVDPAHQGRGVGGSLLEHVKSLTTHLRLTVYEQNIGARRFYERHGFRVVGTSRCRHTGCPELVMEWSSKC